MKVLIVDDSKATRLLMGKMLRGLGLEVSEAGSGKDALSVLSTWAPEVVMVDWNMPEMNGPELVRQVRSNPGFGAIKLVMVTSEDESKYLTVAKEAGADGYLTKPFTRDALLQKLGALGLTVVPAAATLG
jgi:two-component system chemotaxis response regulator CheY